MIITKIKEKPLLLSLIGWVLFPGMYLLGGIFTSLGISVEASFLIASPVGLIGFIAWVAAFIVSLVWLVQGKNIAVSVGALVSTVAPLGFLGFAFWVAVNGGI